MSSRCEKSPRVARENQKITEAQQRVSSSYFSIDVKLNKNMNIASLLHSHTLNISIDEKDEVWCGWRG